MGHTHAKKKTAGEALLQTMAKELKVRSFQRDLDLDPWIVTEKIPALRKRMIEWLRAKGCTKRAAEDGAAVVVNRMHERREAKRTASDGKSDETVDTPAESKHRKKQIEQMERDLHVQLDRYVFENDDAAAESLMRALRERLTIWFGVRSRSSELAARNTALEYLAGLIERRDARIAAEAARAVDERRKTIRIVSQGRKP